MDDIIEKLMEKVQDIVKQKVQYKLKKYQDTTNKKPEKTQKQLNESERTSANTKVKQRRLKKEIHEIKKTT
jgi:protein required for attachment to host cells